MEEHDDCRQHQYAEDGVAVVSRLHRLLEIAAQPGQPVVDVAHHDDFARDEEVPPVGPRDHAVVGELVHHGGQNHARPVAVSAKAELLGREHQVLRNRRDGLVDCEDQIPQSAGDDQKDCSDLHADRRIGGAEDSDERNTAAGKNPSTGTD